MGTVKVGVQAQGKQCLKWHSTRDKQAITEKQQKTVLIEETELSVQL
jgi:hypothetical protein